MIEICKNCEQDNNNNNTMSNYWTIWATIISLFASRNSLSYSLGIPLS